MTEHQTNQLILILQEIADRLKEVSTAMENMHEMERQKTL